MNKNNTIALALASLFLLQGCASVKKIDDTAAKSNVIHTPQTSQEIKEPQTGELTSLQRCLNNASTLIKLDNKYQKNYNELYILINDAKFYASLSGETSENVKSTIAPLFEYEVNNKCNDISQLLIDAFKYKIKQTSMLNGNS